MTEPEKKQDIEGTQMPSPEAGDRDPMTGQKKNDRSLTEGADDDQSDGGVGSARDTAESPGERLR